MAHDVQAVAGEILRDELPVRWNQPLLRAAQQLGFAVAAIPRSQRQIERHPRLSQVFEKRRSGGIPRRPDGALVGCELGNLDQAPLRLVEWRLIGGLVLLNTDQAAVGAVAPAMIGADEVNGMAFVVTADFHAAMAAGVEKDARPARGIARENYRFLAHARDEVIARLADLTFMADVEPGARENSLELLAVEILVDENLAADFTALEINQASGRTAAEHRRITEA